MTSLLFAESDTCKRKTIQSNMDQQGFIRKRLAVGFNLPRNMYKPNGNKLDVNAPRGINGSLQWLSANSRVDFSAKVFLSASETAHPTISILQQQTT